MTSQRAATVRLAVRVAAVLSVGVCAIAVLVHLSLAEATRRWLAFPFTGIPATPAEAGAIFVHNLRAMAAVVGLALIAQSPYWGDGERGSVQRALQRAGEGLLAAGVAANLIVIGASFGAYGVRMVRAVLPHGPFELGGYSVALALYLQARHERLPARHALLTGAVAVAALGAGAALETFVNV